MDHQIESTKIDVKIKESIIECLKQSMDNNSELEKPSITWYDKIRLCKIKFLNSIPNFVLDDIKSNPYVISKTVRKFEQTNRIQIKEYFIEFYIYTNDSRFMKFKLQLYHFQKKHSFIFLLSKIIFYLIIIYLIINIIDRF